MSTASPTVTQTGVYKPIDDAWIGLLVLAILIFVLSIIGLILLLILWNRYQKQKQLVKDVDKSTATSNVTTNAAGAARRPIPVQVEPYPPTNYETQRMELYVPPNDEDVIEENFGRLQTRFNPEDGIEEVRQYHQRATKAYF